MDAPALAAARLRLRRRREAESVEDAALVAMYREWATVLCPEHSEGLDALPDSYFRPSEYRNPEGWGQDPDELRQQIAALVAARA